MPTCGVQPKNCLVDDLIAMLLIRVVLGLSVWPKIPGCNIDDKTQRGYEIPLTDPLSYAGHERLVDAPIYGSFEFIEGRLPLLIVIPVQDCMGGPQLSDVLIPLACGGLQLRQPELVADWKSPPPQPPTNFVEAAMPGPYLA